MLAWILYVILITLLLSVAGLAAERAARLRCAHARWIWVVSILASLAIPTFIASVSVQVPSLVIPTVTSKITTLRATTAIHLLPLAWVSEHVDRSTTLHSLSLVFPRYWIILSATLAAALMLNGTWLSWRTRRWWMVTVAGARVYIAPNVGPAVVGLLRPRIVLPTWLTEAPRDYQAIVVAHEQAHLARHDPQVLGIALFLLVLMPWNLPLWWQLHRLRGAIEVDCDKRVLKGAWDTEQYRKMLLDVSQRPSAYVGVGASMSEPGPLLEPRIGILRRDRGKRGFVPAVALGCLAVALVAVAAQITPPNVSTSADGELPGLSLAPEILNRYVGLYVGGGHVVVVISREGSHLFIRRVDGVFPSIELTAETETDFWLGQGRGSLRTFVLDEKGHVTEMVEHEGRSKIAFIWQRVDSSTAQRILTNNKVRFQSQMPVPGSEAALRRMIDGVRNGKCIDEQAPWFKKLCEETIADGHWDRIYASWGAVRSVKFWRVDELGQDVYDVRQERGLSEWAIYLDDNGVIQDAQHH